MNFEGLDQLRRNDAAWRLLRADNAPLVAGVLKGNPQVKAIFAPYDELTKATLSAIEQNDQRVVLRSKGRDGAPADVTARYVVACDGANSFVRKALGIALDDMQFHEPSLAVDA